MRDDLQPITLASELMQSTDSLASIETAVWLIVGLLIFGYILLFTRHRGRRQHGAQEQPDWQTTVELAYDKGNYDEALQALATAEMFYTRSAKIKMWQGRCYFQQEAWAKAAAKFEECVRLEPWYRKSVRDCMAFIELNRLVPGVEGYLDKD